MIPRLSAFVVAAVGVLVFKLTNLPLPWLLGPIFACLGAALAGVPMSSSAVVNDTMRTILGVAIGATFTTTLVVSMAGMWTTLILIPVMVACIGAIGVPYFQKIWGFDFATSYYSAMPGGLQDMLAFGEEAGGDVRAMSLIHATRVMVIVAILPFLLQGVWDVDLSAAPGVPASSIAPSQLLLMLFCAIAGWQIARAVGMFGAAILGPLILAAIMALTGLLHHRPPTEAIAAAQFFIGLTVGTKYVGVTMQEIRTDVAAALGFCLILLVLTVIFAEAIHLLGLAPPLETILSFAPGGQAEMAILALIAGADMAFVVAHHVLRIFIVILGAPVAAKLFRQSDS